MIPAGESRQIDSEAFQRHQWIGISMNNLRHFFEDIVRGERYDYRICEFKSGL